MPLNDDHPLRDAAPLSRTLASDLECAAAALAHLDVTLAAHPLIPAWAYRARLDAVHDWGCRRSCPVAHELNSDSLQPCASRAQGCKPSLARHSRRPFGPMVETKGSGARNYNVSKIL